jgi:hypothetical protein
MKGDPKGLPKVRALFYDRMVSDKRHFCERAAVTD